MKQSNIELLINNVFFKEKKAIEIRETNETLNWFLWKKTEATSGSIKVLKSLELNDQMPWFSDGQKVRRNVTHPDSNAPGKHRKKLYKNTPED